MNAQRPASQRQASGQIGVSPGDPEAALGLDKEHVFRPLYTVQTVRDVTSPFILGYEVFAQASDAATLPPMLRRSQQLTGRSLKDLLYKRQEISHHFSELSYRRRPHFRPAGPKARMMQT
jgi:hypothetical protein